MMYYVSDYVVPGTYVLYKIKIVMIHTNTRTIFMQWLNNYRKVHLPTLWVYI